MDNGQAHKLTLEELYTKKISVTSQNGDRRAACLNFQPDMSVGYILGYLRASTLLCDFVIEKGQYEDTLVYPIFFSFRHYLELQLKNLLKLSIIILGEDAGTGKHHQLSKLWTNLKDRLVKIYGRSQTLEAMDYYVQCIGEIDCTSQEFRYPYLSDGKKSLEGHTYISISTLRTIMNALGTTLDGLDTDLQLKCDLKLEYDYIVQENRRELEAEFRDLYEPD